MTQRTRTYGYAATWFVAAVVIVVGMIMLARVGQLLDELHDTAEQNARVLDVLESSQDRTGDAVRSVVENGEARTDRLVRLIACIHQRPVTDARTKACARKEGRP